MTAPELHFVPHFAALQRIGCSRMAIAVYGVIAAYHARGYHPSVREIAWTAKHATRRHAEDAIAELVALRMLRREREPRGGRRRNRYDLLGPTLEAANQQQQEKTA